MSRVRTGKKVKLNSYDDLFGSAESESESESEQIRDVSLSELHVFKDHPFKIRDDEEMEDLVKSIKEHGVLAPLIVRKDDKGYEMISGHRRKYACDKLGIDSVQVIIKELTDDEAIILMVDSNIQRERVLPSEKAFAYKMKLNAMKRQAGRPKNNLSQLGTDLKQKRSDEVLAEEMQESRNQIQRYIRLTYLIEEFLNMVDSKKLPFNTAVELSYLKQEEQTILLSIIANYGVPSLKQATELKEYSKQDELNENIMKTIMNSTNISKTKVNLNYKTLSRFFPESYTSKQMEDIIVQLLEEWSKNNK